jgi:hypothetical protein
MSGNGLRREKQALRENSKTPERVICRAWCQFEHHAEHSRGPAVNSGSRSVQIARFVQPSGLIGGPCATEGAKVKRMVTLPAGSILNIPDVVAP